MNWVEVWRAISARMIGLVEAGGFLVQSFLVNDNDAGEARRLIDELRQIVDELRSLHQQHEAHMPPSAALALRQYIDGDPVPTVVSGNAIVALQSLARLQMFRSRFTYLIQDTELEGRNATELAFEHLRRLIAVDEQVRRLWQSDFDAGETACERRGAVHLLSHGIFAFKVTGRGAATDLVYGEPIDPATAVFGRVARAIVLTEWKCVRDPEETAERATEARHQTDEYAGGVLGGLELKRTRYVILVGQHQQIAPSDVRENTVTYRHIWLPVEPQAPFVAARTAVRRQRKTGARAKRKR
jgi:hypothetical protein